MFIPTLTTSKARASWTSNVSSSSISIKTLFKSMRGIVFLLIYFCFVFQVHLVTSGDFGKIYKILNSSYFCLRRLNQTHQVGCGSNINGNIGIVKLIHKDNQHEDLKFISKSDSILPFIAVISTEQYANLSFLLALKAIPQKRIAGVIILETKPPVALSSDRSCPNMHFSLYVNDSTFGHCRGQEQWNLPTDDHNDGMAFQDFSFPIFLLRNKTEINFVNKKIQENSSGNWQKLAAELVSPMFAVKDSITCLRRSKSSSSFGLFSERVCNPLIGRNIFHHTLDLSSTKPIKPNSVIVLAVRQDSFSMFNFAPGADSVVSSLVVALAVAEMLFQPSVKTKLTAKEKSLMFAMFDGEAFDYIGSSDTVYRMENNNFNLVQPGLVLANVSEKFPSLNLSHISTFIELNQLAQYSNNAHHQIYLHKDRKSEQQLNKLIELLKSSANGLSDIKVKEIEDNHPLPPSSAQSFLKKRRDGDFSVLVITNHERKYLNKYYNSFYEDGKTMLNLDQLAKRLQSLATLLSRVLYHLISDEHMDPNAQANLTTVQGLLNCYLHDSNCALFKQVKNTKDTLSNTSEPSLSNYLTEKKLRSITHRLLFCFTGEKVTAANFSSCVSLNNQKNESFHLWLNGESMTGECIKSSTYRFKTLTPALDQDDYLNVIEKNLPEYALWTESGWQETSLRIFVIPSSSHETFTFIIGIILLVVSFMGTFTLQKYSSNLFFENLPRQ